MTYSATARITLPLDIPQVNVLATKQTRNGQFIITVESRQATTQCGICRQTIQCNNGHGTAVKLRHLPVFGLQTYIKIRPRRGRCANCLHQPTTTQTLTWYQQRSPHTIAYDKHLVKQLIGSSVADVSQKEQVGYDAILGALQRQVPDSIEWDSIDNLGTIGIDEIAHRKGRKHYRAIITSRQDDGTTQILAVLSDRKKSQ